MRQLIVLLAAAALCAATYAAPPTEESINALLSAARTEKVVDSVYTYMSQSMRHGMKAAVKGKTLSQEQQRTFDALPAKFEAVMKEELRWDKLRPMYIQIYQETFTQGEIDGLTAFYKSPTGTAFVDKMPLVLQKTEAQMQARFAPLADKINAAIAQAITEPKAAAK
ncbi:MAG TPA: DUF2059 domain-containing protein [Burkholderiaceae bacterium]|nr:DUF2059 domain-containing protein [Burkholderiaceae bacterium]